MSRPRQRPPVVVVLAGNRADAELYARRRSISLTTILWPRDLSEVSGLEPKHVLVAPSFPSHSRFTILAEWFAWYATPKTEERDTLDPFTAPASYALN